MSDVQIHHIESGVVTHVWWRLTSAPPTAKCGALIWDWTDDNYAWEYCDDCLALNDDEGNIISDELPFYSPDDVDPDYLVHTVTDTRRRIHDYLGFRPSRGLCGNPLVAVDVEPVGRCSDCDDLTDTPYPDWIPNN